MGSGQNIVESIALGITDTKSGGIAARRTVFSRLKQNYYNYFIISKLLMISAVFA